MNEIKVPLKSQPNPSESQNSPEPKKEEKTSSQKDQPEPKKLNSSEENEILLRKIKGLEKAVELLYWVKAKQITTPESHERSLTLDKLFKHKSMKFEEL